MPFAILRITKHHDMGTIRASSEHMTRDRATVNADPARRGANTVLIGDDASPADLVNDRHEAATIGVGRAPRKNGVRALEVMLTTSPEWAASASSSARAAWQKQSQAWLADTFGYDNVVSLVLHDDETTPHLTGFVVPVDPDSGRLNAARWMDGRKKLAALQTGYAKSVADLGLSRGIAGSTATHQTVRDYYGALESDVGKVTLPPMQTPPAVFKREEWAASEHRRLAKAIAPQVAKLQLQARAGLVTAQRASTLEKESNASRALAGQLRDLPLTSVLKALGLQPDKSDRNQWVDDEKRFRITIRDERQFMDHAGNKGGGGAIDLVKQVLGVDYKGSVSWLAGTFGATETAAAVAAQAVRRAGATVAAAQKERPPFALPAVEPDRQLIRSYLCGERGLDQKLVEHLTESGQIVTDERRNVGFVMLDETGTPRGLELKGTNPARPFAGLAPGSSREATFRIALDPGRTGTAPRVVLTESAIDAISYVQLHAGREPCLVASTSGARPNLPDSLKPAVEKAPEVAVGYDNDRAGDSAATRLLEVLRTWYRGIRKRLRPRALDWNDDARGKPSLRDGTPAKTKRINRDEQGL